MSLARFAAAGTNLALGVVVYWARPDRVQNRLLALMLFLNFIIHSGVALVPVLPTATEAYAAMAPTRLAMVLYVTTYLVFTGTLDTPWSHPFRTRTGIRITVFLGAAYAASFFFLRDAWYVPATAPQQVLANGWETVLVPGFFLSLLNAIIMAHFVYGLLVALHAWRRAKTSSERRKMKWFAMGFVIHDLILAFTFAAQLYNAFAGTTCVSCDVFGFYFLISAGGVMLAASLSYGILATQLFDIDLRIKRGISKGTVAAAFVAVFVGVAAATENYLSDSFGFVFGGLAAAILVFAIAPLQRVADRLSNAAMPHVEANDSYVRLRKEEVFQAAVEGALRDGEITEKERTILAALASKLSLTPAEALQLERKALRAPPSTSS